MTSPLSFAPRIALQILAALSAACLLAVIACSLPIDDEPDLGPASVVGLGSAGIAVLLARRLGQGDARPLGAVFGLYWMGVALMQLAAWMGFHLVLCTLLIKVGAEAVSNQPTKPGGFPFPAWMIVAQLWAFVALVAGLIKGARWNLPDGRPGVSGQARSILLGLLLAVPTVYVSGGLASEIGEALGLGFGPHGMAFAGIGATLGALVGHQLGCAQRPVPAPAPVDS